MFGQTPGLGGFQIGMQDKGARRRRRRFIGVDTAILKQRIVVILIGQISDQSSPSYRFTGPPGMMVEIACL